MQNFLHRDVLLFDRRYRTDIVFTIKTIQGQVLCDTMKKICKSIGDNQYAHVSENKAYFSKFYPIDSKTKARDDLKLFYQEFDVPEKLILDGSKEQACKGNTFMK